MITTVISGFLLSISIPYINFRPRKCPKCGGKMEVNIEVVYECNNCKHKPTDIKPFLI